MQRAGTYFEGGIRGHLVTLDTVEEAQFVQKMLEDNNIPATETGTTDTSTELAWIGASDLTREGSWFYVSGPSFTGASFFEGDAASGSATNGFPLVWWQDQPSPGDQEDCGAAWRHFTGSRERILLDRSCSNMQKHMSLRLLLMLFGDRLPRARLISLF
eukprot:m.256221 g.256221  ORF g.256221 m.256221 type:complete len:159 (+) comp26740_c1_seq23:231-707(+)